MKGSQRCHHSLEDDDSVSYMSEVNKGAQKIITAIPDQLASVFIWTVSTGLFVFILVTATYLVLRFESSADRMAASLQARDAVIQVPGPSPFRFSTSAPIIVNVTTREFCSTVSKDLYSLEQMGYVDTDRRVSKLMALKIGSGDVHYVFVNSTHVPWLFTCSLESVLRAVDNNSRVNVFVVYGIETELPPTTDNNQQRMSFLPKSLSDLMSVYGGDRLNVVHVNTEECLECSPFQGVDLSGRPALAKFVVQLVLLWQFGGTVLDAGTVAVRDEVYRANGTAVEYYGDRTISSPVACHAFVYDAMLCAKSYALQTGKTKPDFVQRIMAKTAERTRRDRRRSEIRPMADGIVCRNGVISDRCYYVEPDRGVTSDPNSYVRGFCPTVGTPSSPWSKTMAATVTGRNGHRVIGDRVSDD